MFRVRARDGDEQDDALIVSPAGPFTHLSVSSLFVYTTLHGFYSSFYDRRFVELHSLAQDFMKFHRTTTSTYLACAWRHGTSVGATKEAHTLAPDRETACP